MSTQFWSRRAVLKVVSSAALVAAQTRSATAQAKARHRVLVENPSTLYDFPKGV
jgi:predicted TIM-barrel fold metal-dependent hydrolase